MLQAASFLTSLHRTKQSTLRKDMGNVPNRNTPMVSRPFQLQYFNSGRPRLANMHAASSTKSTWIFHRASLTSPHDFCASTCSKQRQLPETIDATFSFSFSDLKNVHLAMPLLSQGWRFHGRAFLPGLLGRAPPTWTRRSVARASHRRRILMILQPSASISWWLRPSCSGSLGGLRVPQGPQIWVLRDSVKSKSTYW